MQWTESLTMEGLNQMYFKGALPYFWDLRFYGNFFVTASLQKGFIKKKKSYQIKQEDIITWPLSPFGKTWWT